MESRYVFAYTSLEKWSKGSCCPEDLLKVIETKEKRSKADIKENFFDKDFKENLL